jgi:hypothetical protein
VKIHLPLYAKPNRKPSISRLIYKASFSTQKINRVNGQQANRKATNERNINNKYQINNLNCPQRWDAFVVASSFCSHISKYMKWNRDHFQPQILSE